MPRRKKTNEGKELCVNLDIDERTISKLLRRWKEINGLLAVHFENRETNNILIPMEEGIEIFLNLLFLTNDNEWNKDETAIIGLQYKPVNVMERLLFINKRPTLYHSFIQLSELITEQEKQYNKKKAIQKRLSNA
jgi:hypothetical protein